MTFCFITSIGYALTPFKAARGVLSRNLFTYFWFGLGLCIMFLQVWNLFLPVNFYTWVGLFPFAVYGAVKMFSDKILQDIKYPGLFPLLLLIAVFIFLVIASFDNLFNYDTLAYQFYSIKWLNSYPAVKGLGNLYSLLAYNQSYFLFPAFLNAVWGGYKGACATNGLLALVICTEVIFQNTRHLAGKEKLTFLGIFQLLFLPLCINIGVQNLSSPYPDVLVNILTFKVLSDLIKCIDNKKIAFQDVFIIAFYCTLGVVIKLSFAGVALGCFLVLITLSLSSKSLNISSSLKAIALFSLLIMPWMIRGVISSGYIGFPVSMFGFDVDWKMPVRLLKVNSDFTIGFSRTHVHGSVALAAAHGYEWLPGWIKRTFTTFGFYMPVLMFFAVCIISKFSKIKLGKLFIILSPVGASIVFWFFTAPDLRFVVFTFWGLGLASIAYFISESEYRWLKFFPLVIYAFSIAVIIKNWNNDIAPLGDLPKQQFTIITTKSGLKIRYISGNPRKDDWQISDCTLPCTVFPDTNIMLRGRDIKDGFRTIDDEYKTPALNRKTKY
ncbi:LIC_10190 family membrane protein [Mucilaginibacter antarcticus]|uniref:LIC_10190 family membrane protein n=1 Tax=Mucilaginibacter antarcticus TaxID=1855725 RepID=UPI003637E7F3